ncbi:hypothetical protein JSQ81_17705 [Sporosarcina sp. Marseille-Q4063]|uniref:hypothetical protein n=1 Tax=Sporosarcina sp. Marseille-Q4063 TaxID=2810514 RepID=UPI001BAF1420|nr:hypothetical protein [Sporosarcina sp. Marseille-Q4063]QUW21605.1 hypothetical protein JSQ81_17705 [Sporosarcina sp. Marseille-Q4063]
MERKSHIICGVTSHTPRTINMLKMGGEKAIFVLDYNQSCQVREENGIVYISKEWASQLVMNKPNTVYHHFIYKRPGRPSKVKVRQ